MTQPDRPTRILVETLRLPFEKIETIHEGGSEVRLYLNTLTGLLEVGKRFDTLGVETSVAAQEGAILQRIQHPHLVQVFSVAEVEGEAAAAMRPLIEIIMPYFPLGSVCDAFGTGRRFSLGEARDIAVAALRGLAELHDGQRILHRDVKTPNIFLSGGQDVAKLGDLGGAGRMDNQGQADGLAVPQLWTPPETFTGGRVSARSDIYSMGLTLTELISGPFPYDSYERLTLMERLTAARRGPLPRHLKLPPFVPRRLRRIVSSAISVDPDRRPASAAAMAADLAGLGLVNWTEEGGDESQRTWVGRPTRGGIELKVEARWRPRLGRWDLVASQRRHSWRRVFEEWSENLSDQELRSIFDRLHDNFDS